MNYTINDTEVYKNGVPKAPTGYRVVGFRPPRAGERFIAVSSNDADGTTKCIIETFGEPRLIVEPIKRLRIVLEEIEPPCTITENQKIYDKLFRSNKNFRIVSDQEF